MPLPAQLLTTKLYLPPVRPNRVPRPRLIERLNTPRPLTLIAAPAGFGKTTVVSEWHAETGQAIAWLSLDEDDNDPTRFISLVVAALQTLKCGSRRNCTQPASIAAAATAQTDPDDSAQRPGLNRRTVCARVGRLPCDHRSTNPRRADLHTRSLAIPDASGNNQPGRPAVSTRPPARPGSIDRTPSRRLALHAR